MMLCHKATTRAPEWIDHIADTVLLNLQYGELMKKKTFHFTQPQIFWNSRENEQRQEIHSTLQERHAKELQHCLQSHTKNVAQ